ncbi:hypothetical protein F4825DRAFT_386103 [Nemania diffusa]|nr:hypothetical protein F4825DRAFT_386103 [Nemania diffusa]
MASSSAPVGEAPTAEVLELRAEVDRLRAYQALAEYNLTLMGYTLEEAQAQGWVSKRAEIRRKRRERKQAAEDAKWAQINDDRRWIREQRKKVGLPIDDPTPSPSEAAYRDRVAQATREETERRLQNQVRRLSHQLLIAAAIGKQYREVTAADHSGHFVPGAEPSVPLRHRQFDARTESSMATSDAMARSFRNWANREKAMRFRKRSQSPETVVLGSRTTGPEDTPSGTREDSPFTDDEDAPVGGANVRGARALRALAQDPAFTEEYDSEIDVDEEFGLTNLGPDDVSDEVIRTAYGMLSAAQALDDGKGDWANTLANDILGLLLYNKPTPPPSSISSDSDSESDVDELTTKNEPSADMKAALKYYNMTWSPEPAGAGNGNKKTKAKRPYAEYREAKRYTRDMERAEKKTKLKKTVKSQKNQGEAAIEFPKTALKAVHGHNKADKGEGKDKGPSRRKPNKPAAPCRSVYDPTWWRRNTTDANDGAWACKPTGHTQPQLAKEMETGFVPWAEQERRFPHLDARLRLHDVSAGGGHHHAIFDRETAETQVWDPLSRSVAEPRTGRREPLRLGPVTALSLARWMPDIADARLDPVRMPANPPDAAKKRPLPAPPPKRGAMVSGRKSGIGRGAAGGRRGTGAGTKKVSFDPSAAAATATPTRDTPEEPTNEEEEEAAVASVHYPLKSPSATSISRSPAAAGFRTIRASPPGPPTPYPRVVSTPDTPSVALYEDAGIEGIKEEIKAELRAELEEGEQERLAAILEGLHVTGASGDNSGKRAAAAAPERGPATPTAAGGYVGSDSEKENATAAAAEEVDGGLQELEQQLAQELEAEQHAQTPQSARSVNSRRSRLTTPRSGSRAGEKKAVRFQLAAGPSPGMRYGARRAVGRLGLTSERRGPLGPYR